MSKFEEYLQKVYNEKMEGSHTYGSTHHEIVTGKGTAGIADTYQLELVDKTIIGKINNKDINMNIQEFTQQYPKIAKEILPILKEKGAVIFTPDKKPPYDFVKSPTTKNVVKATPDIENVENT